MLANSRGKELGKRLQELKHVERHHAGEYAKRASGPAAAMMLEHEGPSQFAANTNGHKQHMTDARNQIKDTMTELTEAQNAAKELEDKLIAA